MSNKSLRIEHIAKSYGKRQVLTDVSFAVEKGQVVGLLGPNGAGKTTSFYIAVGLVKADAGQVWLGEQEVSKLPIHRRAKMGLGYLPQDNSIFRKLTVAQNLMAVLQNRPGLKKAQQLEIMDGLLQEFHITHIRDSLGMALSGGERRRVEIARCLAMEPEFVLLDEPFAGVDPISVSDIKSIITHLKARQIGVLITDHNVRETLDICEQAFIVGEGKIIAQGNAEQVLANQVVRDVYLGHDFKA